MRLAVRPAEAARRVPWRERAALTYAEVAEALNISESTARRVYGPKAVKIGSRDRIPTRVVLEAVGEAPTELRHPENAVSAEAEREVDRVLRSLRD